MTCNVECGGCDVQVEKTIPACGHTVKMSCGSTPERKKCKSKCERELDCGHKCTNKCSEDCVKECTDGVSYEVQARYVLNSHIQ